MVRLLYPVGIPILISGRDVPVNAVPAFTIVSPFTVPAALTVAVIVAPYPIVDAILTSGAD